MIEPSWVGRRVTVRRVVERADDGRLLHGDVVGDLLELDGQSAVIETRAGLVEVPLALVVLAKPAPPSTADELALERVVADSWRPAEVAELDGWRLRADHGFTKRANSVLPLGRLRRPLPEALAAAREWYSQRGLPLLFQLPVEARRLLDAELGELGWTPYLDVAVLVRRLDLDSIGGTDGPDVTISGAPDDAWLGIYRGGQATDPSARALLVRHDAVAFVSVQVDGRTVAVGRGTVDDGWLGIGCVEVDPAHRRQGYAGRVMDALDRWGLERGATRGVLEVEHPNTSAAALYERRGWWHHHDYRYRLYQD